MVSKDKIPTINQMKNWVSEYSVSSVNGKTGDITNIDADTVDGYDIQKNGTDASGIINFKT